MPGTATRCQAPVRLGQGPSPTTQSRHDARELAGLLGTRLDGAKRERAAGLVEAGGGRAGAAAQAEAELGKALAALDGAPIDAGARADLADIARFVAAREF